MKYILIKNGEEVTKPMTLHALQKILGKMSREEKKSYKVKEVK